MERIKIDDEKIMDRLIKKNYEKIIEGHTDRRVIMGDQIAERKTESQTKKWLAGWMDEWKDRQMDRWMDGCTHG